VKAAVCYEFGQPLVIDDLDIDAPQRGEVKVKFAATAICHSDVHLLRGEWGGRLPLVAGHESSGIIAEVGQEVTALRPGDPVVVSLLRSCGGCPECMHGSPHLCSASYPLDSQPRLHNQHGLTIYPGLKTGSFAEYAIVDQSQCVKVPGTIRMDSASLLACSVITGLGAVMNTARVPPGSCITVIGVGGVGLNSIQGAVLSDAQRIIAVDLVKDKLDVARSFGATEAVNAAQVDAVKAVRALTGGAGVDYAFVTVGNAAAIEQAPKMVRRGGCVVVVGLPEVSTMASVRVHSLVAGERRILGSYMGSTHLSADVPRLVEYYQEGRLKLDELISRRYSLDQINEAIAAMEHGQALRNVILF
jgi:Zn-dependent alcohol dehydrogenase